MKYDYTKNHDIHRVLAETTGEAFISVENTCNRYPLCHGGGHSPHLHPLPRGLETSPPAETQTRDLNT